jgi:hypothetical protein
MTVSSSPDPLPMRWAVILVSAGMIALLVGALTFVYTVSWPATLLAALGAGGTTIPALHQVLGT